MAISTNGTIITRLAGALYGEYLSNASYLELSTTAPATVATNFLSNDFASKTDMQLATTILTNLGLTSITGLDNWLAAQFTAAGSSSAAKGAKLVSILNDYSQMAADPTYGTYATSFNAKTAASLTLSQTAGNLGGSFSDADSVSISGQTFTLTTGTNRFTGTIADDTFDAGISSSSLQTLNSGDSLDGGAGSDALFAVVTGSVTPSALKNIEVVNVTNTTTASTLDLSNATGLTSVTNQASTVGLTLAGISKSGPTVTVRDTAIAGQVVTFNDVTGTADAATVVINNLTSGSSLTVAGVETLTLQSDGTATNVVGTNAVTGLTAAATTKLNITGAMGVTFATTGLLPTTNQLPATIVNLDASGNTSTTTGINVSLAATASTTITGSAGNDTFISLSTGTDSVNLGAGNDSYTNVSGFTTTDTIDGGAGNDTLVSTSAMIVAASATTPTTYTVSNIETINVSDSATTASYTPANISTSVTTMNVLGATLNNIGVAVMADGVTMTTVGPAGSFALGLGNTTTTAALGVIGTVGAQGGETLTISDTGTATTDSLTINNRGVNATTGAQLAMFNTVAIGVTGYETVTINNGSVGSVAQTIGAITLTGDQSANTTLKLTGANVLTTGAITANVIDASALTAPGTAIGAGTAAFQMSGVNTATTITGSAGIDNLIGHASSATSIDGGAGADSITAGSGNDTILGGAGNDSITSGSGNDSINAGDGNDTITVAANLASGDVIDGGAGTDTLLASAAIAAAAAATVSNVEVISFSATASQDMTAFLNSGITTLGATAGALTVTNAQTTLTTLVLGASGASAVTGANVTRLVDGSADTLSILLVDGTTGGTTLVTPSLANEETLTIGESGTDSTAAVTFALGTVTATDLKTLTITGSNNHTMTLSGETLLATVDASAATGTLNIAGGNSAVNMTVTGTPSTAMSIVGGSGNDSITAGAAADSITGGNGNDTIIGNAGNDTIIGGLGVDSLVGGDGTDTISAAYTLSTDGGSSTATGVVINISSSAVLATTIAGYKTTGVAADGLVLGVNSDISSVAAGTMVNLGLSTAVATTSSRIDTLSGFEAIQGSTGTDYLVGSSSANTITGGTGADVMVSGSGADTIVFADGDGVAPTVTGIGGGVATVFEAGETITFGAGADVITDFSVSLDFISGMDAAAIPTTGIAVALGSTTGYAAGTTYFFSGAYVASTGVFTIAADGTGADTLILEGAGASPTVSTDYVILVGIDSDNLLAANFIA
jgi:Ca2+-binding RTX toxin-like protein